MADDVEMIPVSAEEPPKADPLAKPAMATPKTLKLNPVPRPVAAGGAAKPGMTASALRPGLKLPPKPGLNLPPKPGATVSALKPGLKLPPKPGAGLTALKPGLKLPPKPGATVSALKPGLNLPPKPGATVSALKPGLNLPPKPGINLPQRPVIRKPGATVSAMPLPKPVAPKPVAPEAPKPAEQPAAAVPVDAQGVGKLSTVSVPAVPRAEVAAVKTPVAAEAPKPMEALKSVTQKLKGITQPIPQQAILHKTGIIADAAQTEAQKEAAKHKTARISLSDAMGVAPVQNENAPMKTIRIKRPVDIPGTTKQMQPAAADATPASEAATIVKPKPAVTATQRKTLKIARPGGAVRPTGKFGVKKPTVAAAKPAAPAAAAAAAKPADGEVADIPDIADIPELPAAKPVPVVSAPVDSTPGWLLAMSLTIVLAASGVMGTLAYFLYENTQTLYF